MGRKKSFIKKKKEKKTNERKRKRFKMFTVFLTCDNFCYYVKIKKLEYRTSST